jgi:branched-chain amino acid transport system substrate-binding protein
MINESTEKEFGKLINNSFGIIPGSNSKNINSFNKIAQKNNIDTSGPFIGESYDAAAVLILALQEKNFKSNINLSKNIMSVSNSPGTKIYPGEIAKGLKLLKKGKKVDYEGATNIEFDINGDAFGTFLEKEVIKGKFKTRQQR